MTNAIEEFLIPKRGGGRLPHVRRLLADSGVPPIELAYVTIKTVVDQIRPQAEAGMAVNIGHAVLDLIEYKKFKKLNPGFLHAIESSFHTDHAGHRRKVLMLKKRQVGIQDEPWDKQTLFDVGYRLIDLLIVSTGIVERVTGSGRKSARIEPTEEVLAFFKNTDARCELLSPVWLPMVVPPVRWSGVYGGGFLNAHTGTRHKLIRTDNKAVLTTQGDMPLVYRALNALQETPWRINRKVYDVLSEMWKSSTGMGVLPNPDNEPLPATPWTTDEELKLLKATNLEVVKQWNMRAASVYQHNAELRSKRFAFSLKLCMAERFREENELYFCWNLDWRGRMYPIQNHLEPQSDDIGKALLEFGEGKRLGDRGVYWLAIHGANCYGQDKAPFEDRVKWVQDNERAILDSAYNPLDGERFWTRADDPCLFLAFCFEWEGVKRDGANFISHQPVRLDGTCNGLQHYAALLRDPDSAKEINLWPGTVRADIYQKVAQVVAPMVREDLNNHTKFSKDILVSDLAWYWHRRGIDRNLCKQAVMTTPYGISRKGIEGQLREAVGNTDSYDLWHASLYLAGKVQDAISQTVVAAPAGMKWLQAVAKTVNTGQIIWTTPSGFRVRQEYFVRKTHRIETSLCGTPVKVSFSQDTDQIDKRRQSGSIAPQFIHSMDASHLVLTVNKCLDKDIHDFAMIHDSYGTHAANVDTMAEMIRQAFLEMYTEPVLERFRQEVASRLPEALADKVPPVPKMGDFDIEMVLGSGYFFC